MPKFRKVFGEGVGAITVEIVPYVLNEVQRRHAVLRQKEDAGYYRGLIYGVAFNLGYIPAMPTPKDVARAVAEELLFSHDIHTSVEELLGR